MVASQEMLHSEVRNTIEALQLRYVAAVDGKNMPGWLECFTGDGAYFVTGADNHAEGLPLCLMLDDCYERLQDRVTYVDKVWKGSFEDYQTRHFVQTLSVVPGNDALLEVRSNMTIFASDLRGRTSIFVAGQYQDLVRIEDGAALFRERRVLMDTFATPGVVVYPL